MCSIPGGLPSLPRADVGLAFQNLVPWSLGRLEGPELQNAVRAPEVDAEPATGFLRLSRWPTNHPPICSFFLRPHLWHRDVPRLGVELELQVRPTPQPQQRRILNPPKEARDQTHILTEITLAP